MITIEKPLVSDIKSMQDIVMPYVKDGIILYRSDNEVATTIRSYTVLKDNETIIGFAALHIHSIALCEIRSLIIKKEYRQQGLASKLILSLIDEAKKLKLKEILVLTYVDNFFKKLGFEIINKEDIPDHKIWLDCSRCKHFPICNEISLIKHI